MDASCKHIHLAFLFGSGPPDLRVRFANSDSNDARYLPKHMNVNGGLYNVSVESCVEGCGDVGYNLAGVEFGHECCMFSLRLFDELSSPDQTPLLLKGVTISSPAKHM
jgi:hypothetical protein